MNKAIEAVNKNIKKILRKIIHNHRYWNEQFPYVLLGYKKTITICSPALFVYGIEVVIHIEIEIPLS
ncbi:hypothetical protein T459_30217 [Capsicum annuum]|uniref:Uncharacterized protein n=1 Tax=Capsicum annuum TaxID=4072 RepID=A0A2G2Y7U2_CAPAN|nr:hypothetical protein T459_30217 [Capsicum annuum]